MTDRTDRTEVASNLIKVLDNNNVSKDEATTLEPNPISNFDIMAYKIPTSKVVLYSDLEKYKTIEEVFGKKKLVFLLYQNVTRETGHWVLLHKIGKNFHYFCSYGLPIDTPVKKWYAHSMPRYLGALLKNRKDLDITYNHYPFQKKREDIATCGKWCLLRAITIYKNKLPLEDFINTIKIMKNKTKRSYDNIVSDLIPIQPV